MLKKDEMVTIITTHPWENSFNNAIATAIKDKLDKEGKQSKWINLATDGFNPCFAEQELAVYNTGVITDPLIKEYQKQLKDTDTLILIFPIWWGTMPAILKGFFDKVMSVNFAYDYTGGWNPLLTNIKQSLVITTSESPTEWYKTPIEDCMFKHILEGVGSANNSWLNCDKVISSDNETRQNFVASVLNKI